MGRFKVICAYTFIAVITVVVSLSVGVYVKICLQFLSHAGDCL